MINWPAGSEGQCTRRMVSAANPGCACLRKMLIIALARYLFIALWRLVNDGIVPDGLQMRPAA
jgi:hypothetical protein